MIYLKVYDQIINEDIKEEYPIFDIKIYNKLNLVLGNSGAGKTYLCNALDEISMKHDVFFSRCVDSKNNIIEVRCAHGVAELRDIILQHKNNLIIIDEDTTESIRNNNLIGSLLKSNNYFILLDRGFEVKIDINVKAVLEFKDRNYKGHRVFDCIECIGTTETNKKGYEREGIRHIITEDSESGALFWKEILSKLNFVKSSKTGNGAIKDTLKQMMKKDDNMILVALDYDAGSVVMSSICKDSSINMSRLRFISLESFEEVICNSEFILGKFPEIRDKVINYKDNITAEFNSTGKYFSAILFYCVKVKRPNIKSDNEKNKYKFYDKGAEYFKECFIEDCCGFNNGECKLHLDGNKKEAMLANKFEGYRVFI